MSPRSSEDQKQTWRFSQYKWPIRAPNFFVVRDKSCFLYATVPGDISRWMQLHPQNINLAQMYSHKSLAGGPVELYHCWFVNYG